MIAWRGPLTDESHIVREGSETEERLTWRGWILVSAGAFLLAAMAGLISFALAK